MKQKDACFQDMAKSYEFIQSRPIRNKFTSWIEIVLMYDCITFLFFRVFVPKRRYGWYKTEFLHLYNKLLLTILLLELAAILNTSLH